MTKKEKTALLTLYRRPFYNPSLTVRDVCWYAVFHSCAVSVACTDLTNYYCVCCVSTTTRRIYSDAAYFFLFSPRAYLHRHNHGVVKVVFLCPPLCRRICETLLLLELVVPLRFENFEAVVLLFPFTSPWHPLVALCVMEDTTNVLFLVQEF